jgi:hypothetical protein
MLLSDVSCGYGGKGPHGSLEILRTLRVQDAEALVFTRKHVKINMRRRRPIQG